MNEKPQLHPELGVTMRGSMAGEKCRFDGWHLSARRKSVDPVSDCLYAPA